MIRMVCSITRSLSATSLVAISMLILTLTSASPAAAGFTPDRPVYDYLKTSSDCSKIGSPETARSRCGAVDGPVFNSFVNSPSYDDERAFVDARLATMTRRGPYENVLNVGHPVGQSVVVRLYINNAANEALGARSTAHGTRVRLDVPTGRARALRVRGYISADDAQPSTITDTVEFVSPQEFRLEYEPRTAILYTDGTYAHVGRPVSDDVVEEGSLVSNTGTPGEFEAGFDKDAVVQLRLRVVADSGGWGASPGLMVLALLGGAGLLAYPSFAIRRRHKEKKPVAPFAVGAGVVGLTLVATILVAIGDTDIAAAGYILAVLGLVVAVVQLVRDP